MCPPPNDWCTNGEIVSRFERAHPGGRFTLNLTVTASHGYSDYFDILVDGVLTDQGRSNVERFNHTDSDGDDYYDNGFRCPCSVDVPFHAVKRPLLIDRLVSDIDLSVTAVFYRDHRKVGRKTVRVLGRGRSFNGHVLSGFDGHLYANLEDRKGVFVSDPGTDRTYGSWPRYYIVERLYRRGSPRDVRRGTGCPRLPTS